MWTQIGAVCSGSTLFASILNLSVILSNYLQQTTLADEILKMHFFLGALRVKTYDVGRQKNHLSELKKISK